MSLEPITVGTCPFCHERPGYPCVSGGGYVYADGGHAGRRELWRREKEDRVRKGLPPPEQPAPVTTKSARRKTTRLRLALWFVDQAGGPEEARALLTTALEALARTEKPAVSREETCGHVYEGSEPGTICDSCSQTHKPQEARQPLPAKNAERDDEQQ